MTAYDKGSKKENEVLKYLEYHGFTGCRSSGSHGNWDLIVSPPTTTPVNQTLHIQCGVKTKAELLRLREVAQNHHGIYCHLLFFPFKTPIIKNILWMENMPYINLTELITRIYGIKTEEYYLVVNKLNPRKVGQRKKERA